jgi:hypothetical protein
MCLSILFLSSCGIIGIPTKIQDILNKPDEYLGREVVVQGTSRQSYEILPGKTAYDLDDGTGIIPVLAGGTPPPGGKELAIKGLVRRITISQSEQKIVLELLETMRPIERETKDWVVAIGMFLVVGVLAVPYVCSIQFFRCLLPRRGPDSAKTAVDATTAVVFAILAALLILFLYRGYSVVPIYFLAGFTLLLVIFAIVLILLGSFQK